MHDRIQRIVAGLSLEQKIRLVSGNDMWHTASIPSAGIPSVMMADGPHGLRKQVGPSDAVGLFESAPATCFPPAVTLASTWDIGLAGEVGRAVGLEARAQGVGVVLGPGLNLKRHPCCGRNFEYFSEDPLLSGMMAAAMVRGIQSVGVGACLKHFVANNQETRRMTVDALVDERALRELYLRSFEIAVREGSPWAVMCAYNRVNGEYCSDSRYLLTEVLRAEWGFGGLVMSDWGATNDRVAALVAGMDLEMPSSGRAQDPVLHDALRTGRLPIGVLDAAVSRVLELALSTSADEQTAGPAMPDLERVHHELARRVAAEGTVLLANDGLLPLSLGIRLALVGALAEEPRYQGTGSSQVRPTRLDTPLEALGARVGGPSKLRYVAGYDVRTGETDEALLAQAVDAASSADVVLVFAGLPALFESEGFDRAHMRLPEGHVRLIEAVCEANPRCVVVLANGSPVEMEWVGSPGAILETYLGGQACGAAVADVLFGDAEPGGRLAETFPLRRSDVPADEHFPGTPQCVEYREALNVGYRYFETSGTPVRFPFGHGLSYTEFEFGTPALSSGRFDADRPEASLTVRVSITNVGGRAGSTVVQVYVAPVDPGVPRPRLELAGFAKVRLPAGVSAEAVVELGSRCFALYDPLAAAWRVEPGEYDVLVGTSAADIRDRSTVNVESVRAPGPLSAQPARVAADAGFAALLGRPVPAPPQRRPYTRTTAVEDLGASRLGRLVQRALLSSAKRRGSGGLAASDEVAAAMMERVIHEMPLRNIVTMSQGRLSWRALDALIEALNGRWIAAARRLLTGSG